MKVIKCKLGHVFSACSEKDIDAEWKLEEAYYAAQGCKVESIKHFVLSFSSNCKNCQSIEHEFEQLIEEIKAESHRAKSGRYKHINN